MSYRWASQYCSSKRALLLFQVLLAVLSRAFSPKTRSKPEQLAKACSRSMVYSDGDAQGFKSLLELNTKPRTVPQIG